MGAGVTHKADSSTPPLDSSGTNKTSLKTESKGDGQHVSSHYKPKSQSYVQEKYTGGGVGWGPKMLHFKWKTPKKELPRVKMTTFKKKKKKNE